MTVAWRQFVLNLDALDPSAVEAIFSRFGASSLTLTDAGDRPVLEPGPGETPLWTDTRITGLFSPEADLEGLRNALQDELGLAELPWHRIEDLEDRDWEREWLKDFGPMQFGQKLWISPKGSEPFGTNTGQKGSDPFGVRAAVVYLDPGLAFGTGTHATTALCLEWLDGLSLEGKTILDYGCGSGILSIAALKLGCAWAVAMDIDPQACVATRQNAIDNDVAQNIEILSSADEIRGHFDLIVANILAAPLVQFAESITSTLRGHGMLALSGILCEQADEVMAAYEPWIDFDDPVFREQDGQIWSRLSGKRRAD
ncbi:MAG: 50S ribosomal protein L11 methyltransferase [Gammaproteobacteria bacterium]|nr:50S ribosomal protein L11 methyltransferase [Gammaproteobacteria bacterium]